MVLRYNSKVVLGRVAHKSSEGIDPKLNCIFYALRLSLCGSLGLQNDLKQSLAAIELNSLLML